MNQTTSTSGYIGSLISLVCSNCTDHTPVRELLSEGVEHVMDCSNATSSGHLCLDTTNNTTIKTTTDFEPPPDKQDFIETRINNFIRIYVNTILLVLGTVGNLLSIAVLSRKNMRKKNVNLLLMFLQIVDTMYIWNVAFVHFGINFYSLDIRELSQFTCKSFRFVAWTSMLCSAWYISALTLERCSYVLVPTKSEQFFTRRFATCVLVAIPVVFSFLNAHLWFGFAVSPDTTMTTVAVLADKCGIVSKDYADFYKYVHIRIMFVLSFVIPFSIILFCNIAIGIKVFIQYRKMRSAIQPATDSAVASRGRLGHVTYALILLTIIFLATQLPFGVYMIAGPQISSLYTTERDRVKLALVNRFVKTIAQLNYSVNFLVYCFIGSIFRAELKKMLGVCCIGRTNSEAIRTNSLNLRSNSRRKETTS